MKKSSLQLQDQLNDLYTSLSRSVIMDIGTIHYIVQYLCEFNHYTYVSLSNFEWAVYGHECMIYHVTFFSNEFIVGTHLNGGVK